MLVDADGQCGVEHLIDVEIAHVTSNAHECVVVHRSWLVT